MIQYASDAATGWNSGVTYTSGLSSTRTADALGRLDAITWSVGGATVSGHDYTINALNRRTAAQRQDGSTWSYGYNSRGEVTSAAKGTEPGKQFAFAYDGIGNRTSSSVSSIASTITLRTTGYSANALNQYDSITHPQPGWLVLRGSANTAAGTTVTIDGNAPTLTTGTLWFYEQSVDNTEGSVRREVEITATRPDGGVNNGPVTTQQKGALFIPPPTEVPTYDLDGNLTSDARWNYVWNGENRLVAQEEKTGIIVQPTSSAPIKRTRLEFDYDAEGRRIGKRTFIATGSGVFVLQQSLVELYDGWNMIAEIDAISSAQLLRSYEWGTDVSGTMTGAGGVGGLLIERFHAAPSSGVHAALYDGNGNITELVNLANGNISAHYEYGAFGETISMDGGVVAEAHPFRFSTKYLDAETGFYNYGYRYYDLANGRWLNRDPIGEQGGVNLYGMVGNDPVNKWDYLGLSFPNESDVDRQILDYALSAGESLFSNMFNDVAPITIESKRWEIELMQTASGENALYKFLSEKAKEFCKSTSPIEVNDFISGKTVHAWTIGSTNARIKGFLFVKGSNSDSNGCHFAWKLQYGTIEPSPDHFDFKWHGPHRSWPATALTVLGSIGSGLGALATFDILSTGPYKYEQEGITSCLK